MSRAGFIKYNNKDFIGYWRIVKVLESAKTSKDGYFSFDGTGTDSYGRTHRPLSAFSSVQANTPYWALILSKETINDYYSSTGVSIVAPVLLTSYATNANPGKLVTENGHTYLECETDKTKIFIPQTNYITIISGIKIYDTDKQWKTAVPYIYTNSGWKMADTYIRKNDSTTWWIY